MVEHEHKIAGCILMALGALGGVSNGYNLITSSRNAADAVGGAIDVGIIYVGYKLYKGQKILPGK